MCDLIQWAMLVCGRLQLNSLPILARIAILPIRSMIANRRVRSGGRRDRRSDQHRRRVQILAFRTVYGCACLHTVSVKDSALFKEFVLLVLRLLLWLVSGSTVTGTRIERRLWCYLFCSFAASCRDHGRCRRNGRRRSARWRGVARFRCRLNRLMARNFSRCSGLTCGASFWTNIWVGIDIFFDDFSEN